MGRSTPTTAFDGEIYIGHTMKEFGSEKIMFDKLTAVKT